jgi:hypothetical protein
MAPEHNYEPDVAADLQDYGTVLRASSDRSRYAIYIVTIVTALIFVANYNIQEGSWPLRRLATWYKYARGTQMTPAPPREIAAGDAERLQTIRTEYVKQFAARNVLTTTPLPGVSIDVNDLGLVGGIALTLLMFIVVTCIAREHENLYLALYKVRLISKHEGPDAAHGNSKANLLYHSLAMSQVLSAPPTLARWEHRGPLHHFRVVFAGPIAIYLWVLITDLATYKKGLNYGVNMNRLLSVEVSLAAVLLFLCTSAMLHSRAMSIRWENAFFAVNPHRRIVKQMSMRAWLMLTRRRRGVPDVEKHAASRVVDKLRVKLLVNTVRLPPIVDRDAGVRLSQASIHRMAKELVERGEALAKEKCSVEQLGSFERLLVFREVTSELTNGVWTVAGVWHFCSTPARSAVTN